MQQVDDPPFLSVGTEVSAKYKGAFCEAKVRKVVRNIKCKIAYKQGLGSGTVSDDQIKGVLRVGATVEVKHPDRREYVEATITKIQDCSQYTVVFDDGDITTLRRTALCLKSGRHFNESETLDQLPLTHPEHFGNPVIGGRRGRRSRHLADDSSDDDDDQDSKEVVNEKEEHIGKVVCVESTETKKKDKEKWFPGLVVSPTAQVTVRIRVKDEYLVRSFKDGRYYTVPKKEAMEFTRELAAKQEGPAVQAALEYLDNDTLPTHWDRDALFGLANSSSECEEEFDSDSSDDEPREEKDHFVAQLYKYMDDRGTPLNKVPSITNRDVDLYRLFRAVQKLGGYNRVTGQNQWKAITLRLGFSPATVSVTNLVKQAYKKFLQPFEEFDRKLGCSMSMTPRTNRSKGRSLVRANSVASPKPEIKEPKVISAAEESENTSESSMDVTKSKRKLSTGSGKVKALVEKFEEKIKEEPEPPPKVTKTVVKEEPPPTPSTSAIVTTPTTSVKKEKPANKKPPPPEDKDKRGRKKKDGDNEKGTDKSSDPPVVAEFPVEVGDKLKVYYHEKQSTYEAKVIEISMQQGTPFYLVHYTGWNNRYDEWVPRERIAENLTTSKTKRSKGGNQKMAANSIPPNDGTKSSASEKLNASIATTLTNTPSSSKGIAASKRGRGRSDSQPPRSTTPSSMASNSSRTKSPAAPAAQRRTTRAQPSLSRRTSNNVSDISMQTDSDTDSDEPVKKPTRSSSSSTLPSLNQSTSGPGPGKTTITKSASSTVVNSQSETEEEEGSGGAKGRDYDLNQIRNELKGFKELKSPSPESEISAQQSGDKKPSTSVFDFNIAEESETKEIVQSMSKSSISATESKSSSTDMSSETDSFVDDDSQSSDKTTMLENMTEKLQQKIKAEKLAQAKCLERLGPGKSVEKLAPIKSSDIEKIIKDSLAEKFQEISKTKPFNMEKNVFKVNEIEEKPKPVIEAKTQPLKPSSLDRKPIPVIPIVEKKITAPTPIELKPATIRLEKKVIAVEKPLACSKPAPKETTTTDTTHSIKALAPESNVVIEKDIPKPIVPTKQNPSADIYEFKEPEPFEFETRKLPATVTTSPEIDRKSKKVPAQKPTENLLEIKAVPTPIPSPSPAKKNKKSPTKEAEKTIKQLKIEEKAPAILEPTTSTASILLSPAKIDNTFDALRKSPSFNLNIGSLTDELSMACITTPEVKPIAVLAELQPPVPVPLISTPKVLPPFASPFIETIKPETSNIFDLKADVENTRNDSDDEKLHCLKTELETVKKILLSDASFDLEPKIEKPSIADKVLKALNQQKQESNKPKEEIEPPPVIEPPQLTIIQIAEPPKIELPAIIKKEIEIPLKKPILSSPEHKLDILESIAPKNNDLSETIQKLESAIQKTSNIGDFDEDSSDSTDSERRLVIEDDSQSSETNQTEINEYSISALKKPESVEDKILAKPESTTKDEPYIFAPKFPPSIFGLPASTFSDAVLLADSKPIMDLIPSFKTDKETKLPPELLLNEDNNANSSILKKEDLLSPDNPSIHSESINLLLCEETIPGSPTPVKDGSDIKPNQHPTESDIKPIPMDIECGPISSNIDPVAKHIKSEDQTPNSSPRDSISQDDSSEDLKKPLDHDHDILPKKRRRTRKHSEGESLTKRRRANMNNCKKNNGTDSEDNSDANTSQRSSSSRPSRPCQYNFLVQLDPAMNPNQRIGILKKKIQELRKTYNMIKAELASIDRRRKKLRRREREKKNQQKMIS